jgi:hypothetical protein
MMELILSLLAMLVIGVIGIYTGMRMTLQAFEHMEEDRLRRIIRELRDGNDPLASLPRSKELMPLTFEAAGNMLLAHNAITGEFVSQGSNSDELLHAAVSRFPNRVFLLGVTPKDQEETA